MLTYNLNLDVVAGGEPPIVRLSRYDTTFRLILNLFARTGIFQIQSGTTARIRGRKSDGTSYDTAVSLVSNTVTINGSSLLAPAKGIGTFEICLTHAGKELYTTNFYILVEPSPAERT